jgi:CheY-like chemotaxis protein
MPRILLIDDERQVRTALRQMLEREGYEVAEVGEGEEGLEALQSQPVDLLITDIFMPGKEGIETIREVRKRYPAVKIIAISGGGREGTLEVLSHAEFLGAHRTLVKPFLRTDLLAAIQAVLEQ